MTSVRPDGSLRGAPVAARVVAGWAVAVAVGLLLAALAAASAAEGSTAERPGPSWIAGHLTKAVDAVAPAAAPSVLAHTPSPHLTPATDRVPQVLTVFLLGMATAVVIVGGRLRRGRGTLPPLRGPPHRLSSR